MLQRTRVRLSIRDTFATTSDTHFLFLFGSNKITLSEIMVATKRRAITYMCYWLQVSKWTQPLDIYYLVG